MKKKESTKIRKDVLQLLSQLELERTTFVNHWQELADNMLPRRIRMVSTDRNRGDKRNQAIKDPTALLALRTLRAGMMGGITSPSRPWFRLTTTDLAFRENMEVKLWLHEVTNRMNSVFIRSNLYHALPIIYGDCATFGTAAMGVDEDEDKIIKFSPFTIGSYYAANGEDGLVRVFIRRFDLTVRQLVRQFGRVKDGKVTSDNISRMAVSQFESNQGESWVTVLHVVKENEDFDPKNPLSFKYDSIYLEEGGEVDKLLSMSGFHYFPTLVPRWEVAGSDVYGTTCPGMEALPDVKQLHMMELRGLQAVEKMINPPMMAPTHLKQAKVSVLPGDVTFVDVREGMTGFRPIYEIRYDLQAHEAKAEQVRSRVRRTFFEDLFLMFQQMEQRDRVTAAEINARREEKLLVLGPVLERLNQDLLDPLIELTFDIMNRRGLIPLPPEILQGAPLKVEYLSVMHQAQKTVGLSGIDRLKEHAAFMVQINPEALDKIDFDQITDEYADILGTPPSLVKDDETVAKIREARAVKQQEMEQQAMQLQQAQMMIDAQKARPNV